MNLGSRTTTCDEYVLPPAQSIGLFDDGFGLYFDVRLVWRATGSTAVCIEGIAEDTAAQDFDFVERQAAWRIIAP